MFFANLLMQTALSLHTTTANLGIAIAEIVPIAVANRPSAMAEKVLPGQLSSLEPAKSLVEPAQTVLTMLSDRTWDLGRDLSHLIHSCLAEAMAELSWQDIGFMAIASGIGSFTSTRIGVVLARTLAQQLDIPLFAIDCDTISTYCEGVKPRRSPSQGLLELAFVRWQQGQTPNWSEALPIYGGSPIKTRLNQ
jgi:tRNA threonylcarbamoyladenosine biosynthesis protein TsaB